MMDRFEARWAVVWHRHAETKEFIVTLGSSEHVSRSEVIKEFLKAYSWQHADWRKAKRGGYRCVRVGMRWNAP